ncbi:hypothetical protein [Bacillus canaveralius]|uniref:hypothetical protein n=1 Tax=Bacillus canaveralius TaxID=1403243 RepID=UPI00163AF808|nr:hypothetical protein [Bacillus canaveralius]
MATKAGRRRRAIERFLQKEFKKTGLQATRTIKVDNRNNLPDLMKRAESSQTPVNPL